MLIPNYLDKLENVKGKEICIVGIGNVIKQLYIEIRKNCARNVLELISSELKISSRTLYYWINNKKGIPIWKLKKLISLWSTVCKKSDRDKEKIWENIYKHDKKFSISGGKCVNLPVKLTKDLAYLLGYICGDGCLVNPYFSFKKKKKMGCIISIYEESEQHLKNVIKPLFLEIFDLKVNVVPSSNENSYNITFTSKVIHTFLTKVFDLPFGKKSGKLKIPDLIKKSPKDIQIAFIQGMYDSDGTIYWYREGKRIITKIAIKQATKLMLDEIKEVLDRLKIKSNGPYWDRRAGVWSLEIKDKKSLRLFKHYINFRHHKKIELINRLIL